jgi:hypothetical protein
MDCVILSHANVIVETGASGLVDGEEVVGIIEVSFYEELPHGPPII